MYEVSRDEAHSMEVMKEVHVYLIGERDILGHVETAVNKTIFIQPEEQ